MVKEEARAKEGKDARERQEKGDRPKEKAPVPSGPKRIIRMGEKDIDGNMPVSRAICQIRGIGFMYANAVSKMSGLGAKKVGDLTPEERARIDEMISNPGSAGIPRWMYNRRFDPEDGKDRHMSSSKLELKKKTDINELKKRRCYRGVRHMLGLPVRGQRTRSSFRTQTTVGVSRVKAKPGAAPAAKEGKK